MALEPAASQSIGLALHELATNAAKFGALSTPAGKLDVSWSLHEDALELLWSESNGPAVATPKKHGFGTKAIIASIERQLGGSVAFHWLPTGLHCVLRVALPERRRQIDGHELSSRQSSPQLIFGPRILVLEDEPLVAAGLQEGLSDIGYDVIGPFSRAAQALEALHDMGIDAAILDVNLETGTSYPVAEALMKRGVPFVFVTGYGAGGIDARFRSVPVYQKPLEHKMLEQLFRRERMAV